MSIEYNTVNTVDGHYQRGFFTVGSGPTVILIEGSCRVVPYLNYFHYLNGNNRFTIHLCDVVNFYWDLEGKPIDPTHWTEKFESNPQMLEMLKSVKWFMHEHTESFGMLNTERTCAKNIYQFGIQPEIDIALPNFNDIFILFQEHAQFDPEMRKRMYDELHQHGTLLQETQAAVKAKGDAALAKFTGFCRKSSLPEFADIFEQTWRQKRYWWTGSHVSNVFTMTVFRLLNDKFFHLETTPEFWNRLTYEDMYCEPHSPITKYDRQNYGIQWPQPDEDLKAE